MTDWMYIVTGCSLLLLGFLLWKEMSRPDKHMLVWRIVATLFAVISLTCMALPISYRQQKTIDTTNEAVLLTEGYNHDSLAHFLRTKEKAIPVYILDDRILSASKYNASLITDPGEFSAKGISALHVFGFGLEKKELERLDKQPIIFHPSKMQTGITSINWRPKIKQGEKLNVQGSFHNASAASKKLLLTAFNNTLDSVIIPAGKDMKFQLTTIPKPVGRFVYSLLVIDGKDSLEKQPVPVEVEQGGTLGVLMLASSPDFENRFLKNWLAQKGYQVMVRTAISKNKYGKEFLNTEPFNLDRITASLLDKFDIIIADITTLASMSNQELTILQTSIVQKSKGLIVRADTAAPHSSFYARQFPLLHGNTWQQQQIHVHLIDSATKLQPLTMESPLFIRVQNGTLPLVADNQNRVFVNSVLYGLGRILFSTLPDTYSWALSGNQTDYDQVWADLLQKAAPKKIEEETWNIAPPLPQVNSPVTIILQTSKTGIPQAEVEGTTVHLTNHYQLPYEWTGKFWPYKEGWQKGIQLNGDTYHWYAYGDSDWKNVHAYNRTQAIKQYQQNHSVATGSNQTTELLQQVEVNKIGFFLIFLVSCGFLWFENKYYNRY